MDIMEDIKEKNEEMLVKREEEIEKVLNGEKILLYYFCDNSGEKVKLMVKVALTNDIFRLRRRYYGYNGRYKRKK